MVKCPTTGNNKNNVNDEKSNVFNSDNGKYL